MINRNLFFFTLLFIILCTSQSEALSIDTSAYLKIFLTSSDLPLMENSHSHKIKDVDQDDAAFAKYHGQIVGMNIWDGKGADTIGRIVDIHWVFPDAESAKAYLNETWAYQAEWGKRIPNAAEIGDMSRVYGISTTMAGLPVVQYYYLFQVGRVVSKLFVAQGAQFNAPVLTMNTAKPIALKVVERIHASGM